MPEITVTCGCSRIMRADPLRGSHAYVCGCGNRVRIVISAPLTCIGLDSNGKRCPVRPIRESVQFALPLCKEHYDAYMEALDLLRRLEKAEETINTAFEIEHNELKLLRPDPAEIERKKRERQEHAVVYYVRLRDTIKIGYTSDMRGRMASLLPDELLAMEPGGEALERMRHRQFAHIKIRGERFEIAADLLAHVEMLRGHFGKPVRRRIPYGPDEYDWEPV